MASYYKPRYAMLFEEADVCLGEGGTWDISAYCTRVYAHEHAWQTDTQHFPDKPTTDAVETARRLHARYVGR